MDVLIMAGQFDYAALRREAAAKHGDAAARLERFIERQDYLLAGNLLRLGRFFRERASGDREGRAIHELAFQQAARDHRDAAGLIHIRRQEAAAGLDIDKHRSARQDRFELIDG